MTPLRATICLAAGQTVQWAGLYYLFPALLLRWEAVENWPKTGLTAAFAGAVVFSALASPFAGRMIDRGKGAHVLAGSALLGAVLVALLPLTPNLLVFSGLWLLIGVAMAGCLYEPCFAFITRTRGANARRAITLVTLVAGFASTISFPLNHAVAGAWGWGAATTVMALLLGLVAAPLSWFGARALEAQYTEEPAADAQQSNDNAARTTLMRNPAFWLLALGFSLLAFNHGVIVNHLLPILNDRAIHPDAAVLAASMMGPMQVAGRLAMMAAETRVSAHAITCACFLAITGATVTLLAAGFVPALIVLFVVLQGAGHGVTSIMKPLAARAILGSANFGAITGALAVPYLIATALAPFAGSLLWLAGGYDLALMVIACFGVAGLISYIAAHRMA